MIGHVTARAYLERELPTATLLLGPRSVGKWTLAHHLADFHRVPAVDRWAVEHDLTVSTAHLITSFAARAPQGRFKLVVARLDDADRRALNALLKTLEEPPPTVRFIFTASTKPISTIFSRCIRFELGELSTDEVERIYLDQGYASSRAHRAAVYARGSVDRGYQAESADAHRHQVTTLIKALMTGDRDSFTAVFAHWDARSSELLTTFFTECLTRRWKTFCEADTAGLHHDRTRVWRMVHSLAMVRHARPRLGVRAALEPYLTRR